MSLIRSMQVSQTISCTNLKLCLFSAAVLQMTDPHEAIHHSHPPSEDKIAAAKVSARMRAIVRANPSAPPSQVLASELLTVSDAVRTELGRHDSVLRRLRRQKRGM